QHLQKARVVRCGRDEARTAGEALARPVDVRALTFRARAFGANGRAALGGRVDGREPVPLVVGQVEMRVRHAERTKDALAQELVERNACYALDQRAENVRVVTVDPALAGVRVGRQRRDRLDRLCNRLVAVREVPALNARALPAVCRDAGAVTVAG